MTDHRFTDETATIVVLNGLIRDVRHLLDWAAIGLGCLALANGIRLLASITHHEWIWAGWDALATLVFGAAAIETARRAAKYRAGVRR